MQIHRAWYGVRGSGRLTDYALRWTRMVTDKAKHKARVLSFWQKHGLEATVEAFGVKRRTLYHWQSLRRQGNGQLEALNERPRRPYGVRRRSWPVAVTTAIRQLRIEHPNLGPDKVAILLRHRADLHGQPLPAARTVARIIAAAPDKMRMFPVKVRHNGQIVRRPRAKKLRKPKHFQATYPGHCVALDTVERFIHGCRRYVLTFTDVYSRFSLALATTSHASQAAAEFFNLTRLLFPFRLDYVLTDNGSEFMKHFDLALREQYIAHWHTYPKTPKMNAHDERFNRTIQEEFVDYHESALLDPIAFNQKLLPWLLWYNGERPHWGLNLKSPLQFLTQSNPELCNMWWRDTVRFQIVIFLLRYGCSRAPSSSLA